MERSLSADQIHPESIKSLRRNIKVWTPTLTSPPYTSQVTIGSNIVVGADSGDDIIRSTTDIIVDISVSGVNGFDTGSPVYDTWYYLWLIKNPISGSVAGLFSASSTSPVLPSGYAKKRLISIVKYTSTGFYYFVQGNNQFFYSQQHQIFGGGISGYVWPTYIGFNIDPFIPEGTTSVHAQVEASTLSSNEVNVAIVDFSGDSPVWIDHFTTVSILGPSSAGTLGYAVIPVVYPRLGLTINVSSSVTAWLFVNGFTWDPDQYMV